MHIRKTIALFIAITVLCAFFGGCKVNLNVNNNDAGAVTTGIIGAMDEEVTSLMEAMTDTTVTNIADMVFCEGDLDGAHVVVVKCGVGKVNAAVCAQLLITDFGVDRVINTGVAGSLDNILDIGDIVISTDVVEHDYDVTPMGYVRGQIYLTDFVGFPADEDLRREAVDAVRNCAPEINVYEDRICSGDQFVYTDEQKADITANFGGLCCDMESGSIAQVCYQNDIPFVIIRAISDKADGSAGMDFEEFMEQAAQRCAACVRYMITNG